MEKDNPAHWMDIARREVGVLEIPGPTASPRILAYHAATFLKATSDEVPWCSAFANWALAQAGIPGSNSAAARSWLNWGIPLESPRFGCIVVLARGNNIAQGHVGFFVEEDVPSGIRLLGGNQGDMVRVSTFPRARVLGYRWPKELHA